MASVSDARDANPSAPTSRIAGFGLQVGGAVDLAAGAMLVVLATGLGLVAPAVVGGFGTALLVALSGAVSLGLARSMTVDDGGRAALARVVAVAAARLAGAAGHSLVLVSATGVVPLVAIAAASLVITVVTLTVLGVRAVRRRV